MDAIELSSFSGEALDEVQNEQKALRAASSALEDLIPQARRCLSSAPCLKTVIAVLTTAKTIEIVLNPINWIILYNPTAVKASQTPASSASAPEPTNTEGPMNWYLNTVPGTSVKDFQTWIKTLPDKGLGRQSVFETSNYQGYVGRWTLNEAKIINEDPIVDMQVCNDKITSYSNFVFDNTTAFSDNELTRRANPSKIYKYNLSPRYLRMLSLPKNRDISSLPADGVDDPMLDYAAESSAGAGTFVYIFDHGFNFSHPVRHLFASSLNLLTLYV